MQKVKEEKGSIVLIVVVTMLFLTVLLVGMFVSNTNSDITSKQATQQIKENYEKDINNVEQIYQIALAERNKEYIKEGLILHYDGINNTGNGHSATATTWKDLSGNENDGTLNGITYTNTSGWIDNGLVLDGDGDYIELNQVFKSNESFTVSFVYNPTEINSMYDMLISGTDNNDIQIFFDRYTKKLTTSLENVEYATDFILNENTINKIYNIVFTVEKTADSLIRKTYINNILYEESQLPNNYTIEDRTINFGNCTNVSNYDLKGIMYNIKIYNRALSEQEINYNFAVDVQKGYITEFTYAYTGGEQQFIAPLNGTYKIELWGAQGGSNNSEYYGGFGGYTSGQISLYKNEKLYLYVGQTGQLASSSYNGGGSGLGQGYSGGGATDVRLVNGEWNNFDSLKSRIMVAAGGGAGGYLNDDNGGIGGHAGGLTGYYGLEKIVNNFYLGKRYSDYGGAQTFAGYISEPDRTGQVIGGFGYGGTWSNDSNGISGGGGGYYGGGPAVNTSSGSGGSSFISGHTGCNAISSTSTVNNISHTGQENHYSGKVFENTRIIAGNMTMPTPTTGSTSGRIGNGYAKITYMGSLYKDTFIKYTVAPNYGTTTQNLYTALYTSRDSKNPVTKNHIYDTAYTGNYAYSQTLENTILKNRLNPQKGTGASPYFTSIVSGNNSIKLVRNSNLNRWIAVYIQAGYGTTGVKVSNFLISFADGTTCTLKDAVTNGYIEPLVVVSALSTASSNTYLWGNFYNMFTGGATDTANYPIGVIIFKVKDKSPLSGLSITSNINFDSSGDGVSVSEAEEGYEISISAFY